MIMQPKPVPGTHEPGFVPQPCVLNTENTRIMRAQIERVANLPGASNAQAWTMGECSVVVAREPAGVNGEVLWHMSIAVRDRHPSWDEMKVARYTLLPTHLVFAIMMPPARFYVNIPEHDHVFHLWEIHDPREQWTSL